MKHYLYLILFGFFTAVLIGCDGEHGSTSDGSGGNTVIAVDNGESDPVSITTDTSSSGGESSTGSTDSEDSDSDSTDSDTSSTTYEVTNTVASSSAYPVGTTLICQTSTSSFDYLVIDSTCSCDSFILGHCPI